MTKTKAPPEFPPARVSLGRLRKLADFHKFLLESALKEGRDYNPKTWALKKPGADRIVFLLNLVPDFELLEITEPGSSFLAIRKVKCKLRTKDAGVFVTAGLGECNSTEKKNTNAILKIAKKRAYVDAAITASFTSDLFTQDLEESGRPSYDSEYVQSETVGDVESGSGPTPGANATQDNAALVEPKAGAMESGPNIFTQTEDEPEKPDRSKLNGVRYVSQRQVNYLFAEAREHNKSREEVTGALNTLGFKSPGQIPMKNFDDWLSWARGKLSIFDLSDRMGK